MNTNEESLRDDSPVTPEAEPPVCGPGCNCNAAASGGRFKWAVCLIAVLAIAGILAVKVTNGRQHNATNTVDARPDGFTMPVEVQRPSLARELSDPVTGEPAKGVPSVVPSEESASSELIDGPGESNTRDALEKEPSIHVAPKSVVPEAENSDQNRSQPAAVDTARRVDTTIGESLKSMNELNTVALDQDAVFIFIPSKEDEAAGEVTRAAIYSAQKTLKSKSVKLGLYTLRTDSPDFSAMSSQFQPPAVYVAVKGRGTGTVSGEVTETKLLQAYESSSRAGGCCPKGDSSSDCKK